MSKYPKVNFLGESCSLRLTRYSENNRPAIQLLCEDGSPMAMATVNVPNSSLEDGYVLIKSYGENKGMLEALVAAGVVEDMNVQVPCGHVHASLAKLLISK